MIAIELQDILTIIVSQKIDSGGSPHGYLKKTKTLISYLEY